MGAINLVYRDGATMGNVFFPVLLIFTGTNVALDDLPGWMGAIGRCLPLTHAIGSDPDARRRRDPGAVQGLVGTELLIGTIYLVIGLAAIRLFEHLSRTGATLDRI
ncbi:ABC transporter permease [Nocardioides sp. B-3]|uniref:ABC transporter permease n=1 Tax=Nocardioides sp. B-3 TaxID=2895565 RepID=UPI0021524844|nr:ABC transporter permease [Nocardioides sp. B-3]UUZ60435.1 ABC transporter permease [Nocardioides sp. B-3]